MSAASKAAPDADLAGVFAALGDPIRLRLVTLLCAGGLLSIARLTSATAISRQGVTRHLGVLLDAGLVRDVKLGRERCWELAPERIDAARRALDPIGHQWEAALGRIKAFVESAPSA